MKAPQSAMIEDLGEIAWIKDGNGRFVAVNQAFAAEFHVARGDVVGKTDFYIFPVRFAQLLLDSDLEVMRAGRPSRLEERIFRNGAEKMVEAVKTPIIDGSGVILGTLTVMREIGTQPH